MIYLLDTSAVLIHYRQEPGCERVLSLFDDPASVVLLSSLSLPEFGRVLRSIGLNPAEVDATRDAYLRLFSEILPEGISVFYGAIDVETCIAEIRAPIGSSVVSGRFSPLRSVRVLDLTRLKRVLLTVMARRHPAR